MLKKGILNPQLNALLARVRHTNSLVIADRGFPIWPKMETVDLSLVDDIPTVLQIIQAIKPNFSIAKIYMAREFKRENKLVVKNAFSKAFGKIPVSFEPHLEFKKRVPQAVGLVRTGDTIQYANMILVSG